MRHICISNLNLLWSYEKFVNSPFKYYLCCRTSRCPAPRCRDWKWARGWTPPATPPRGGTSTATPPRGGTSTTTPPHTTAKGKKKTFRMRPLVQRYRGWPVKHGRVFGSLLLSNKCNSQRSLLYSSVHWTSSHFYQEYTTMFIWSSYKKAVKWCYKRNIHIAAV